MCDVLDRLIAESLGDALKKAEAEAVEEIAMRMIADGVSDHTILEYTKLPQQRLNELRSQAASSKS